MTSVALFTGSRNMPMDASNFAKVYALVSRMLAQRAAVLVGDCPTGLDALVRRAGDTYDEQIAVGVRVFRAQWHLLGKRAGPIRNQAMVDKALLLAGPQPFECHAYPMGESRGTRGCMRMAKAAGAFMHITELECT